MRKKISLPLAGILLMPWVIPYLIPLTASHTIPKRPYPDSFFFVTSDKVRIHYRFSKPLSAKGKILLVHGLAGSTFSFKNNIAALTDAGYQVLTVDLPGFGYSDRQSGLVHSQKNRAKWLWELVEMIDQRYIDAQPWHLLGHSMGASTLLAMSNQKPQRVRSMVMIDGAVALNMPHIPLILNTPVGRWLKIYLRYGAFKRSSIARLLSSAYGKKADTESVDGYLAPMLIDKTASVWVDFIKTAKNVAIWDWKNPAIPLLVLWGENDTWIRPAVIDEIRAIAQNLQVTLFMGQGHCPHETDPGFNKVLIDFLDAQ